MRFEITVCVVLVFFVPAAALLLGLLYEYEEQQHVASQFAKKPSGTRLLIAWLSCFALGVVMTDTETIKGSEDRHA